MTQLTCRGRLKQHETSRSQNSGPGQVQRLFRRHPPLPDDYTAAHFLCTFDCIENVLSIILQFLEEDCLTLRFAEDLQRTVVKRLMSPRSAGARACLLA